MASKSVITLAKDVKVSNTVIGIPYIREFYKTM